MTIPSDLQSLFSRLNDELRLLEQIATDGLNKLRPILNNFPNNDILVSFFGSLNNVLFLVEVYERRIEALSDLFLDNDVTRDTIQEVGEELGDLLGRMIETKVQVQGIVNRIEGLQ